MAGKLYQTFKAELTPILFKFFQKLKGTLPNLFYEASITLIPKPDSDIMRKLQANILYEYKCKKLQQNTSKPNSASCQKNY